MSPLLICAALSQLKASLSNSFSNRLLAGRSVGCHRGKFRDLNVYSITPNASWKAFSVWRVIDEVFHDVEKFGLLLVIILFINSELSIQPKWMSTPQIVVVSEEEARRFKVL